MTSLKLSYSPSLSNVVEALGKFTQAYGPADVYYHGKVEDAHGQEDFRNALHVARLFPNTGKLALTVHDTWHTWTVWPVEPYSFEFVAQGGKKPRVAAIDMAKIWPTDAPELLPYWAASKCDRLEDILAQLGFRAPVSVNGQEALRSLFPAKRRGGVYVLHFANGQHYVGQSIDVLHRLRQHQRRHPDIEAISFRALGRKRLDLHEAELIHLLERKRFVLRNIAMASGLSEEPGLFDELMPAADQARWLTDLSYLDTAGARPIPKARNEGLRARHQELKADADYAALLQVLRAYVCNAIPASRRAEAAYWQLSFRPSKLVLVRINVNWQEVIFAARNELGLYFYLCLSKLRLQPAFGDDLSGLTKRYPEIEWEDGWYRAGGGDQITVLAWSPETAYRFVTDPEVVPALRHYNLRLMKRGRCPWANSHSFDLADDLMS